MEDQSTILPGKGEDEDDVEKPRKKLIRAGLPDEMTQCSNDRGGYIPHANQRHLLKLSLDHSWQLNDHMMFSRVQLSIGFYG